jgi:hypothetical protein
MSKIIWESKLKELRQNEGKASVAKPVQFEGQNLQVCMRKYRVLNLMCLLSVHCHYAGLRTVERQDDYHIMRCKGCKNTQYWSNLRYDPDTCLGGLRTIKKICHGGRSPSLNSGRSQ